MQGRQTYTRPGNEPLPPCDTREGEGNPVWLFICEGCGRRFADPPGPPSRCGCGCDDVTAHTYPVEVYTRLWMASACLEDPRDDEDVTVVPFDQDLLLDVLEGEKTVTVRLGWEHDLEPGDVLVLVDAPTRTPFDLATTISQGTISAGAFVDGQFSGHQTYADIDALADALEQYYPDATITRETQLDAVWFQPDLLEPTAEHEWRVA